MNVCGIICNSLKDLGDYWDEDMRKDSWDNLIKPLSKALENEVYQGIDVFLVECFTGINLFVIFTISQMKRIRPKVKILLLMPYEDVYINWSETSKDFLEKAMKICDSVIRLDRIKSLENKFSEIGTYEASKIRECRDYLFTKSDSILFLFNEDITSFTYKYLVECEDKDKVYSLINLNNFELFLR